MAKVVLINGVERTSFIVPSGIVMLPVMERIDERCRQGQYLLERMGRITVVHYTGKDQKRIHDHIPRSAQDVRVQSCEVLYHDQFSTYFRGVDGLRYFVRTEDLK